MRQMLGHKALLLRGLPVVPPDIHGLTSPDVGGHKPRVHAIVDERQPGPARRIRRIDTDRNADPPVSIRPRFNSRLLNRRRYFDYDPFIRVEVRKRISGRCRQRI